MLPAWNCSWREYLHHRSQDSPDSQLYIYQHMIGYFYVSVSSTRWWTSRTRASQILESPAEAFKILMSKPHTRQNASHYGEGPKSQYFLKVLRRFQWAVWASQTLMNTWITNHQIIETFFFFFNIVDLQGDLVKLRILTPEIWEVEWGGHCNSISTTLPGDVDAAGPMFWITKG